MKNINRRQLLKLGAAATAALSAPASAQLSVKLPGIDVSTSKSGRKPKHILFMVSDGMSITVPTLTESFSQQLRNKSTHWYQLLNNPNAVNGFLRTQSYNSMVTDSSAASSAWASGHRIDNAALNILPDGIPLTPILAYAKQRDLLTALVTTDDMCGATPAGFAAVHASRRAYDDIAPQYLNTVDILMAGGRNNFDPAIRPDHRDLIAEFRDTGYFYFDQRSQVLSADSPRKILGLFNTGKLPYTIDHINNPQLLQQIPTLDEMTQLTLKCIADSSGSLTQIEGARIDHAGHANDAAAILHDQLAFDDAVGSALDFAAQRDDTLVIITTDHATGGPALNGMGKSYNDSTPAFQRIANARASIDQLLKLIHEAAQQSDPTTATRQVFSQWMQIELEVEDADVLGRIIVSNQPPTDLAQLQRNKVSAIGQVLSNYNAIGWTSANHTGEWVILSAIGPGAEHFTGIRHHTDVFPILVNLLKLDAKVPTPVPAGA